MSRTGPRKGSSIGAMYCIPLESLGENEMAEHKKILTLQAKASYGIPPPPFPAYLIDESMFYMPRFYGLKTFGTPETDVRVRGESIDVAFEGTLSELQKNAASTLMERHLSPEGNGGAMVAIHCGGGKTVLGVYLTSILRCKTMVIVHKGVIRDQWKASYARFSPNTKVGFIQGTTWEVEGFDVVIAMVQTMAKRDYNADMFNAFGFVIYDEAHHLAAPVMNLCTRLFNAHYCLALSATPERPDGLTPLLHWCLGPEGFRAERKGTEAVRVTMVVLQQRTKEIVQRTTGNPLVSVMLSELGKNVQRNRFISQCTTEFFAGGRTVLILSDRRDQLDLLKNMLFEKGLSDEDVGIFRGGMRDNVREEELKKRVVLCTYGMANEGVDKKDADTLILATPKARVEQAVGRIQRPCETKKSPFVLDLVDDFSVFRGLKFKRHKFYQSNHYEVQFTSEDTYLA